MYKWESSRCALNKLKCGLGTRVISDGTSNIEWILRKDKLMVNDKRSPIRESANNRHENWTYKYKCVK